MIGYINSLIINLGVPEKYSLYFSNGILFVIAFVCSLLVSLATRRIIIRKLPFYIKKSRNKWDDLLLAHRVFERLHHIAPAIILYCFSPAFTMFGIWVERLAVTYMVVTGLLVFSALLDSIEGIYRTYESSRSKPIKGYIQSVKIFIFIIGVVVAVSIIIDRSPWILLSGVGAMAAALILIFKDSVLGLLASIQITSNNMVCLGDWIEVPRYEANGVVIDITLHIIKIKNWDNTVTTIPTYSIISESFKNWRGMVESGVRLIKRSVSIDITSIEFCSSEILDAITKIPSIIRLIGEENIPEKFEGITNLYLFRKYIEGYLKEHKMLEMQDPLLVRNLPPTESGIPVEIYVFSKYESWESFEGVQNEIFDHIIAITPRFKLRIFQKPSGYDFKK